MSMRILVVEDDALIALDMTMLLEDLGHEVVAEAADALTAWRLAEADRPDVALVDIRLALNTNGGVLAKRLYQQLGVRSLFVSGSISDQFQREMEPIRPVGFLGKPVTRRTLCEALDALAA